MKLTDLFEGFSNAELVSIAKNVGEELFGKSSSGLIFLNKVKTMPFSDYLSEDGEAVVDTFDFVFFPSSKTGVDVSDEKLTEQHIDKDGKIYIGGADGVKVLTDPFKNVQDEQVFPKEIFDRFKVEVSKYFKDVTFSESDKWGRVFGYHNGQMVAQFCTKNEYSKEHLNQPCWLIYDPKVNPLKTFSEYNWA